MTTVAEVPTSEVPPFLIEGMHDPFPTIAAWRERHPVCKTESEALGWVVTSYHGVDDLMRDSRVSVNEGQVHLDRPDDYSKAAWNRWLTSLDPPDHTGVRRQYHKPFQPKGLAPLAERIEAICDRLIADLDGRESFDFIEDFAYKYPVDVICEWLDVPNADRETLRVDAAIMAPLLGPADCPPALIKEGSDASGRILRYFEELIAERRANPGDDFLTALAVESGLDDTTLVANAQQMFFAGHETTTGLLGTGLFCMLKDPAQTAKLRQDPDRIRPAIEEFLRWQPPVFLSGRTTMEPVELLGVEIPAGQRVIMSHGGSNRDPEIYPDPDHVDFERFSGEAAPPQMGFGVGRHFCLGAHLARLESDIAFRKILDRWPQMSLDAADVEWLPTPVFRRIASLPVRVHN